MVPDQLLSILSIYSCWFFSFSKNTSFFNFLRRTKDLTVDSSLDLKSTLTSIILAASFLSCRCSRWKCGSSATQGAHQVAQKLMM